MTDKGTIQLISIGMDFIAMGLINESMSNGKKISKKQMKMICKRVRLIVRNELE